MSNPGLFFHSPSSSLSLSLSLCIFLFSSYSLSLLLVSIKTVRSITLASVSKWRVWNWFAPATKPMEVSRKCKYALELHIDTTRLRPRKPCWNGRTYSLWLIQLPDPVYKSNARLSFYVIISCLLISMLTLNQLKLSLRLRAIPRSIDRR